MYTGLGKECRVLNGLEPPMQPVLLTVLSEQKKNQSKNPLIVNKKVAIFSFANRYRVQRKFHFYKFSNVTLLCQS